MTETIPKVTYRPQPNYRLHDEDENPLWTIALAPARERRGLFGEPVDDLGEPLTRGRKHAEKYAQSLAAILLPFYWQFQNDFQPEEPGEFAVCLPSARGSFQCPDRYRANVIGFNPWMTVLRWLNRQGYLVKVAGGCKSKHHPQGLTAAYQSTAKLRGWFIDHHEALHPGYLSGRFEPIHLNDEEKTLIDYTDDDQTEKLRQQIDRINEANGNHSFEVPTPDGGWVRAHPSELEARRIFRKDFHRGGRLYCRLQGLNKKDRQLLRINGKGTTELDYKSHQARMLYHFHDMEAPSDCYGHPSIPRELMKEAMIRVMNCHAEQQALGALHGLLRDKAAPEATLKAHDLLTEVWVLHPLVRETMDTPLWEQLHFLESTIAANIMETLTAQGKPCLGIHDSFVVEEENRELLNHLMVKEYRNVMFGHSPVISEA